MIILDTNVISELMRGTKDADPNVLAWVRGLPERPVTTVINRAEVLAGIAQLPDGRRREWLRTSALSVFDTLGVCLPFVPECAEAYATVVSRRRDVGRPITPMNALIASIAIVAKASVATRDTDGFADLAMTVIDPWAA